MWYKYDEDMANKLHGIQYRKTANVVDSNDSPGINVDVNPGPET
jgi:hypothetical protein